MPLTRLDPVTALVVIDLQKGIIALPMVHPAQQIVARAAQLARAFRAKGLPVALVNVTGMAPGRTDAGPLKLTLPPDWTELVPELERQPHDIAISKQRLGAFIGTALDEELRRRGVTQVLICGISTSVGVESTARSAYDLGYNVGVVVDAITDRDAQAHRHSVETVFPRLAETATTDEALRLLQAPAR